MLYRLVYVFKPYTHSYIIQNCITTIFKKEGLTLFSMILRLRASQLPYDLPDGLKRFYSVPGFDSGDSLLLSPRGVLGVGDEMRYVICTSCDEILRKKKELPTFAIANGFAVGTLPDELKDVRLIEVLLCSLVHSRVHLVTIDGVGCKVMKGHAVSLAGDVSKTQDLVLPRSRADMQDALRIVVVGATTPREKISYRFYQEARPEKVRALLEFYLENNTHYSTDERRG